MSSDHERTNFERGFLPGRRVYCIMEHGYFKGTLQTFYVSPQEPSRFGVALERGSLGDTSMWAPLRLVFLLESEALDYISRLLESR